MYIYMCVYTSTCDIRESGMSTCKIPPQTQNYVVSTLECVLQITVLFPIQNKEKHFIPKSIILKQYLKVHVIQSNSRLKKYVYHSYLPLSILPQYHNQLLHCYIVLWWLLNYDLWLGRWCWFSMGCCSCLVL